VERLQRSDICSFYVVQVQLGLQFHLKLRVLAKWERKYDHLKKRKLLHIVFWSFYRRNFFWCKIDRVWCVKRSVSRRQVRSSNFHTVLNKYDLYAFNRHITDHKNIPQNKLIVRWHFYCTRKIEESSSFATWRIAGGDTPLILPLPEILDQIDPLPSKTAIFNLYALLAPQP